MLFLFDIYGNSVADRGGSDVSPVSNGLTCRTAPERTPETSQQSVPLSNPVSGTSRAVKFILKCIAALDEFEIEELAYEISNETDDELVCKLHEESCITREVYSQERALQCSRSPDRLSRKAELVGL